MPDLRTRFHGCTLCSRWEVKSGGWIGIFGPRSIESQALSCIVKALFPTSHAVPPQPMVNSLSGGHKKRTMRKLEV